MLRYLIDANLPYYFGLWNNDRFIHVKDLNDQWSDETIWQYAFENDLVIVTKDADFSLKVLMGAQRPKVIHLKVGNMRMKQFHALIKSHWPKIEELISENILINVYLDGMEVIR